MTNLPSAQSSEVTSAINPVLIHWINNQAIIQHDNNKKWWHDIHTGERLNRNIGEMLALIHSEISEAWQGIYQFDDKLPDQNGALTEIADALIRIFDLLGGYGIVFDGHQEFYPMLVSEQGCTVSFAFNECHSKVSDLLETYRKDGNNAEKISNQFFALINTLLCTYDIILDKIGNQQIVEFSTLKPFQVICVQDIVNLKAEFNKQRADHKIENRKAADGKKF